ncbi:MAG: hypothetical protein IPJ20_18335 [Flammeovirgaceae bacterium]|nr:hypothetical protein [Flammeovirgaceae bacterium]
MWFSGVKVGTIKEIRFQCRKAVEVTMRVDENTRVH